MIVTRVDFVGLHVAGPLQRSMDCYTVKDWGPKWFVAVEGPQVIFEGEGRRVEVPRARCVIQYALDAKPADNGVLIGKKGKF